MVTYFKLAWAQSEIETAKMNPKNLAFTKVLTLKISILTLWIIKIFIKVMLIIILSKSEWPSGSINRIPIPYTLYLIPNTYNLVRSLTM